MRKLLTAGLMLATLASINACGISADSAPEVSTKAACGPGSNPETGMQGRVSQEDHDSGRAAAGYTCNTELVGSYTTPNAIGTVAGYKVERYVDPAGHECAYYDTTLLFPTNILDGNAGVNVLDMSDPAKPQLTARLVTLAMLSPHESLLVAPETGLLAAVMGNPVFYPGIVDVYDLKEDCRHPKLKSSALVGVLGHESGMSPDGKTFYTSTPGTPTLTAVDISDPSAPRRLWTGPYTSHGLSISDDGNRAYAAASDGSGLVVFDVSDIQARKDEPDVTEVSRLSWDNMSVPQNVMPFTRNGRKYLLDIDEFSTNRPGNLYAVASNGKVAGAARIIDIDDEENPKVISDIRLEVHEPDNREAISKDPGALNIIGGYAGHYCNIPTRDNPAIAACSMILSGLRIFDIRDPAHPREVAYYNAPIQPRLPVPTPASNWAMARPAFVPERKEIWYSDGYSGFYVVRVTNGAWGS